MKFDQLCDTKSYSFVVIIEADFFLNLLPFYQRYQLYQLCDILFGFLCFH